MEIDPIETADQFSSRPQQSLALPRHIHSGRLSEAKRANIIVEFGRSQPQRNLDRADVARLRKDVRDG